MTRYLILILVALSPLTTLAQPTLDSLLTQLETTMAQRHRYDQQKQARIAKLRNLLNENHLTPQQRYQINHKIILEYEFYTFDSAIAYIKHNLAHSRTLHRRDYQQATSLKLAGLLTSSGRYKEAIDILDSLNRPTLPPHLHRNYYTHYRKLYAELSYYSRSEPNHAHYQQLMQAYTDSLLALLPPQSDDALALRENACFGTQQIDVALKINTLRLSNAPIGTRLYSMITFSRSQAYEIQGNLRMRQKYLILSAISDIRASTKDNASLTVLAMLLFEQKQLDRAHRYIKFAVEDAVFYNSRLRFVEISNIFPMITDAYQHKTDEQRQLLRAALTAISVLSLILVAAILIVYRQVQQRTQAQALLQQANQSLQALNQSLQQANQSLQALNLQLAESNHIKEHYIGQFLSICSNYIDKLDHYRHYVNRQIAARKTQELYTATKSPDFLDNELHEFYHTFDTTFLHIYPNFVDDINHLLHPDERIQLRPNELLTTELRIFALIRLGIDDSSRIARLLRYSVNTIYNYRAKMKNRATVARTDFEEMVKKIGATLQP